MKNYKKCYILTHQCNISSFYDESMSKEEQRFRSFII
eukprot:UN05633